MVGKETSSKSFCCSYCCYCFIAFVFKFLRSFSPFWSFCICIFVCVYFEDKNLRTLEIEICNLLVHSVKSMIMMTIMNFFLWNLWPRKGVQPYFHSEKLSEFSTIANLQHAASISCNCVGPDFEHFKMMLSSSDSYYTMVSR